MAEGLIQRGPEVTGAQSGQMKVVQIWRYSRYTLESDTMGVHKGAHDGARLQGKIGSTGI